MQESLGHAVLQLAPVIQMHLAEPARNHLDEHDAILGLLCRHIGRCSRIAVHARIARDLIDRTVQIRQCQVVPHRLLENGRKVILIEIELQRLEAEIPDREMDLILRRFRRRLPVLDLCLRRLLWRRHCALRLLLGLLLHLTNDAIPLMLQFWRHLHG